MDKLWSFQLFILWSTEILFCFGIGGEQNMFDGKTVMSVALEKNASSRN